MDRYHLACHRSTSMTNLQCFQGSIKPRTIYQQTLLRDAGPALRLSSALVVKIAKSRSNMSCPISYWYRVLDLAICPDLQRRPGFMLSYETGRFGTLDDFNSLILNPLVKPYIEGRV